MKKYLWLAFTGFLMVSCKQHSNDHKKFFSDPLLYSKTVKKLNDIVLENNFPPMIAARNYAYANIAAYEVIAAGDKNYTSLAGQIHDLKPVPKPADKSKVDFPFAALIAFCKVG